MKLCVIGAGGAGLAAAKNAIEFGYDTTVFEQTSHVGGTWVYDHQIGKNEYGIDVHSSMYRGLHTNLPKEVMGYPDFPIPQQDKSYIPAEDIVTFYNLYANKFDIFPHIKFEHYVLRVHPLLDNVWEVIVKDLKADKNEIYIFDAILVCNGHYHTPALPIHKGRNTFRGKIIHSHDYRCPDEFEFERVLVIGAGPSGMDLAKEISTIAKSVTISHRLHEPLKTKFQENVDQKPDIQEITESGAIFVDGSSQLFTVILYCTGYKYTFPFLSVDCGILCDDNYVRPLYKHCLSIFRPSLGFIGLPYYVCANQMFDLQARFCLRFITQQKYLPSEKEMLKDFENEMNKRWSRGLKKYQAHMMGSDQNNYYNDLATTADISPLKPVITKLHNWSSMRFIDDLTNFRNDVFRILDDETFIKL